MKPNKMKAQESRSSCVGDTVTRAGTFQPEACHYTLQTHPSEPNASYGDQKCTLKYPNEIFFLFEKKSLHLIRSLLSLHF